ncbi:MAG: hypothetical protein IKX67_08620 [Bacteroidales bacterium]|nr:hypothetical protein [Bacteroidales bacterium]
MKLHNIILVCVFLGLGSLSARAITPDWPAVPDWTAEAASYSLTSGESTFNAGPFSWLKGIKSPQDLLNMCHFGIQTHFDLNLIGDTDTSLKGFTDKMSNNKLNFTIELGLPVGTLTFATNLNFVNWDGNHFGTYALAHYNFYNMHAVAGVAPDLVVWLPRATYAWGNSSGMTYRQLDISAFFGLGFNETAYVFWDEETPHKSVYHADRRFSIVGLKGLVEAYADYDLWDLAYGLDPSGLNEKIDNMFGSYGPLSKFIPVPFADLFVYRRKTENRYYDMVLNSEDTGNKFGWNFGLLYTRSFYWDLGPGRLIFQPRVKLTLFDSSIHDGYGEYMKFRTGFQAIAAVNYFF